MISALLPGDDAGVNSTILEVRSGAGGNEAALFTAEMLQMYQKLVFVCTTSVCLRKNTLCLSNQI